MSVATFYTPQDMLNPYVWFGSVTVFTGTQWTATDGVYLGTYTGTNFQYGGTTGKKLISGTITGYQESKNGTVSLNITGLSADVATLNSSIYSSDALGADKYMYRGSDVINGSTGDDTIVGYDGADQLYGNNGNDLLVGEAGNDKLDGGSGMDLARYSAVSSGFSISKVTSGFTVTDKTGAFGTDTLVNIERIQFLDKKVALDVTDNALETMQFLGVIAPSQQGNLNVRSTILSLFDQGKSMQQMSQLALDLGLITSDNTALAKTVFKNVFNTTSAPDLALTNTLVRFIEQNGDAKFLATVASLNINVDLVGLQQHGMEFI